MKYLGLVGVAAISCVSVGHVNGVTPLPPNATPQQRMWFWETYRPRGDVEEVITVCHSTGGCTTTRKKVIQFADGRVVRDPNDLAPLVAPDSRTRRDAESAVRSKQHAGLFAAAAVAGIVAGIVIAVEGHNDNSSTELYTGIGISCGSLAVGGVLANVAGDNARTARERALGWYPHDLAENLHVCFNGVAVVPCEMNTPGTPPPASSYPPASTYPPPPGPGSTYPPPPGPAPSAPAPVAPAPITPAPAPSEPTP